ncbi:MAG: carbohydrate-binding protein [Sphingobacteriales bacterium]|nr:MAG: carbohydrate-binding protein [Sphingobacteriales bacterium]
MKTIVALLFFIGINYAHGQGFLKTDGKRIVNDKGENILLRGMGLGGWMLQEGYMLGINKEGQQYRIKQRIDSLIGPQKTQEFYDAWLSNHTTRADIDSLKSWGFNSVRLPMHYNLYSLPIEEEKVAGQQTWLEKGFKMTDELVSWCKANKMYLILDLHAAPGGQGNDNNIADRDPSKPSLWDSHANQQKTIELWKKLAERYKDEPTIIAYDLINEPNWGFENSNDKNGLAEKKNEPLEKLMREITTAIRAIDKNHIIIIEGNGWGNNYNGILEDGLWDNNMVLSFHKYWNYNDQNSITHIIKLRDQYNVPVWLGETGENSNVWFTQAIQLLEANNIGWAWWPLKKLGYNNPLQVKRNKDYDKIAAYWNGKTAIPTDVDFYNTLMTFANNTHIKNNIFHADVVDAMMRQSMSNETRPFAKNTITRNAILKAVDYDLGKNQFAYYDLDTANYRVSGKPGVGNKGGTYRNDGVDIFKEEGKEDLYVGSFETNEWLQYTVNSKEGAEYNVEMLVSALTPGEVRLSVSGRGGKQTFSQEIAATGGETSWQKIVLKKVFKLSAGENTIRITATSGGFNLKELKFLQGNYFIKKAGD